MLNPDFDMDYLIQRLPEAAAQGKMNIVRMMLLKISENPALVKNPTDLLGTMLIKAAEAGQLEVVRAILGADTFRDIPANYLSFAVSQARAAEHPDVIEAFRGNDRAHEVRVIDDREALASILREASREEQLGVVRAIMEPGRFHEISIEDLGDALRWAAGKGHVDVAQAIIGCDRFHEISARDLGRALIWAVHQGQLEAVRAVMESSRFL